MTQLAIPRRSRTALAAAALAAAALAALAFPPPPANVAATRTA